MKIRDTDYLYATMNIRANEKTLLTKAQISRMVEAKTPDEAAKILSEVGYPDLSVKSFSAICSSVSKMQKEAVNLVSEACGNSFLKDVFLLKYDFHNIKALIKSHITGEGPERLMSDLSTVSKEKLIAAVNSGNLSDLPERMAKAIELSKEKLAHTKNPQIADFILDRACFDMMFSAARESGSLFLEGYVKLMCDVANLRTAVRIMRRGGSHELVESAFIPGGNAEIKSFMGGDLENVFLSGPLREAAELGERAGRGTESLMEFERELDNVMIRYVEDARYVAFDEKPIIAYLAAKETEAQTVRIIMAGKFENLSPEQIRSRLRGVKNG